MIYKLQYKENELFVDTGYERTDLEEVKTYLDSIREVGIIYRIFSVRYNDAQKKPKKGISINGINGTKINKEPKIKKVNPVINLPKPRKYLHRINKGP